MCVRILVMLTLCGCVIARGQVPASEAGTRSLSLEQCISLALSRNLDLQIKQVESQIFAFELGGAYGAYDPVFSFRAVHEYDSQPGDFEPQKFSPDFPYQMTTKTLGWGLAGNLPIGLNYEFGSRFGTKSAITDFSSDPNSGGEYFFGIRYTNNAFADAGVTLRQHLLKDFWIDQDRETIRLRRKDLEITEQAVRFEIMKTVLAVELGYYDLIAARQDIRAWEQALELKQQFLNETRRRVEVGDLPPLDTEQAETQFQNTLTSLTASREVYASRQTRFKSLLTDDFQEWADAEVAPSEALLALPADIQRSESFRRALSDRPDLAEARLAIQKSDVAVKFRYNQLFPTLDLIGRYAGNGVEQNPGGALSDTYHFGDPSYFYGVVVSSPLSRVSARNQYKASKAAKELAELQLRKVEQSVFVDVADWVNRAQSRYNQVSSTRKARTFAEAALAAEQKKLLNGFSTSFFVLQLQDTLASARTAEIQALAEYNKALAQLAFAEGGTLQRHRLRLEVR